MDIDYSGGGGGGGGERMDIHYFAKLMYNMRHIQVAWR